MATASFIFLHIHPMLGGDFENCIVPPAPPPAVPYTPYVSFSMLSGNYVQPAFTKRTYGWSEGVRIMQKGTDCGWGAVPHFGNPLNILYPIILIFCKSKSHFGVASVKVEGTPVATAIPYTFGINLNCGTISTPTGVVICPTSIFAGMTLGDIMAGVFNILIDVIWDIVTRKIFGTSAAKSLVNSILEKYFLGTVLAIIYYEGSKVANELLRAVLGKLLKKGSEQLIKLLSGTSVGSRLEEWIRSNPTFREIYETDGDDTF